MINRRLFFMMVCAGVMMAPFALCAQVYKPTVWVHVTYRDFLGDPYNSPVTCPDFEPKAYPPATNDQNFVTNMVGQNLDRDGKPTNGTTCYFSKDIQYWFRDWTDSASRDPYIPTYNADGSLNQLQPIAGTPYQVNGQNVAFQEYTYEDSLLFTLEPGSNGIYQYVNPAGGFFPLDGKQPGYAPHPLNYPPYGWTNPGHNYSFSMTMHRPFVYRPNMSFQFKGDDDMWVFINGKLAADLGGIHSALPYTFYLDNFAANYGLVQGQQDTLDVFYCERHVTGSDITITTDIISVPDSLSITVQPSKTIHAGDTLTAQASIYSADGLVTNFTDPLSWGMIALPNRNPQSTFNRVGNQVYQFTPTKAYDTVKIWASDVSNGVNIKDTATVIVLPAAANHLVIEPTPDMWFSPNADNPVDTVRISSTETNNNTVYAILRDKFGNYVSPANPATWTSADTSIVTAQPGPSPDSGQGQINRITKNPSVTLVTATSSQGFSDNVPVKIDAVTYDTLEIVVKTDTGYAPVTQLTIQSLKDTTLYVEGMRSDSKKWELTSAVWSSAGISVTPAALSTSQGSWTFTAENVSTGTITTTSTKGSSGTISTSIAVTVVPGTPDHIKYYSKTGDPGTLAAYGDTITVKAGEDTAIVAKMFDQKDQWLANYESDPSLTVNYAWTLSDAVRATINPLTGIMTMFSSDSAWLVYKVTATYSNGTAIPISQPLYVKVIPDAASELVIEPNPNGQTLSPRQPQPFPGDTITILANQLSQNAYAVLRDTYGNYVGYSNPTTWTSGTDSIATVATGIALQGQGIITKSQSIDSGVTVITATDINTGIASRATLVVRAYYYTNVKIAVKNPGFTGIDSLLMNTNQDTTLYALGQRSDDTAWELVKSQADWSVSQSLQRAINGGQGDHLGVSPKDTGSGWIVVSLSDSVKDSIPATFTPGPPTSITITVSPNQVPTAGKPFFVDLQLNNLDGPVPGHYCGTAMFSDTSGSKGTYTGYVIIPMGAGVFDTVPLSSDSLLCFDGGTQTVQVVLFNAPDQVQNLSVDFNTLKDTTNVKIVPGPLYSLELEDNSGQPIPGADTLISPAGTQWANSIGFDQYGNLRGPEYSKWSVDSTLHAPKGSVDSSTQVMEDAQTVTTDEEGNLCAAAKSNPAITACTHIVIEGPQTTLVGAVTRDTNGDGYLDRIELTFSKGIVFPADYDPHNILVFNGSVKLSVDTMIELSDSLYYLDLTENKTADSLLQTSWRPRLTLPGTVKLKGDTNFACSDGAGPVIYKIIKTVKSADRTDDIVTVYLSEKVIDSTGGIFNINRRPSSVFDAWTGDSAQTLISDLFTANTSGPDSGKDITYFLQSAKDSILTFQMTNGKDLTTADFMNIIAADSTLKDNSGNFPSALNRKVQVEVDGQSTTVQAGPNPFSPTFNRVPPGILDFKNYPQSLQWVYTDHGGTVILVDLSVPGKNKDGSSNGTVRGAIKIYDIAGNLVQSTPMTDLMSNFPSGVTEYQMDVYWNGSNGNGMKVAPGVYKAVIYLSYTGTGYSDQRKYVMIGIAK